MPDLPAGLRLMVTAAAGASLLNVNMTSSLVVPPGQKRAGVFRKLVTRVWA